MRIFDWPVRVVRHVVRASSGDRSWCESAAKSCRGSANVAANFVAETFRALLSVVPLVALFHFFLFFFFYIERERELLRVRACILKGKQLLLLIIVLKL